MHGQFFSKQLEHEVISTAKMLNRLPADKFDWKPHPKSMTLGQLAAHIVDLTGFVTKIMDRDELDFATEPKNKEFKTAQELSEAFKAHVDAALERLNSKNAEDKDFMMAPWTLKNDGQVIVSVPRAAALRSFAIAHLIHHRGQLSVYIRLLDISVPSIYGPSADEMN